MKRSYLAASFAVLYFALSFNAYACLLPLYGSVDMEQGSDCAMPKESPVRDACDAFKALGVQTLSSAQPLSAFITHVAVDNIHPVLVLASALIRPFNRSGTPLFERDPLILTSLLRI